MPYSIDIYNTIHKFFDPDTPPVTESRMVNFSSYVRKAKQMISYLIDNLNSTIQLEPYVLCPIYGNKQTGDIYDIQIGVTGSPKHGERTVTGVNRELGEELGIFYPPYDPNANIRFINHQSDPSLFAVSASNLESVDKYGINIDYFNNSRDDKSRKICIIVFSDFENINRLLSDTNFSHRFRNSEHDIIGVAGVNIKYITDFIENK